jgi:hypothetical protein
MNVGSIPTEPTNFKLKIMETRLWEIRYVSCEGNDRWHVGRFPEEFEAYEVESRYREYMNGGCGDDPSEFVSCESWWGDDDDCCSDYTTPYERY